MKESMFIMVNSLSLNKNIGKYHLPHLWDEVLINNKEPKLNWPSGYSICHQGNKICLPFKPCCYSICHRAITSAHHKTKWFIPSATHGNNISHHIYLAIISATTSGYYIYHSKTTSNSGINISHNGKYHQPFISGTVIIGTVKTSSNGSVHWEMKTSVTTSVVSCTTVA